MAPSSGFGALGTRVFHPGCCAFLAHSLIPAVCFSGRSRSFHDSKQLRTRDCVNCKIFLYSKTDPVVEASHGMVFAPFNGVCPNLDASMRAANLEPQYNHWQRVFDFSADDTSLPTPHWSVMGA
jgi:hypothetical protein